MYCYYMAAKEKQRGYRKRMYETWQSRVNFECTDQRLCDQKKQIIDKALLIEAEIQSVRQQLDENQSLRDDIDPNSIIEPQTLQVADLNKQQTKPDNLLEEPTEETQNIEESEPSTEYTELKEEFSDLLQEVQSMPMKDRARLPRLKVDNTPKKQVKMINGIIKEFTPESPALTNINQLQYTGATLITSKIVPSKQGINRKAG